MSQFWPALALTVPAIAVILPVMLVIHVPASTMVKAIDPMLCIYLVLAAAETDRADKSAAELAAVRAVPCAGRIGMVHVVPAFAEREQRAAYVAAGVGLELAGRAGARLAGALGVPVHSSTVLRLVMALPDPPVTVQVCPDGFVLTVTL